MATAKRHRQRENRDARRAAEAKTQRRQATFKRVKRLAVWGVIAALVLLLANFVFGAESDEALGLLISL